MPLVPSYRLVFPTPEGVQVESAETAHIETGDTVYNVNDVIEYHGKRWLVTHAPLDQPTHGESADLRVWPADS